MWERAVSGDARAAEVLFYLANRAPQRWQDLKKIQHDVQVAGGVLMVPSSPEALGDWGARAEKEQRQLEEETSGREIEVASREPPSRED